MVVVKHRGYTIEAEAVKLILLEPELAIAQQEVEHCILAVVEAQRVPSRMLAAAVTIEVEVVAAVKSAQTLNLILHRMRVHDIHNHGNSTRVRVVDKVLELLGGTKAARSCIETRHMVTEGTIIGMFLDCHNLDCVITVGSDARQHVLTEFIVGAHTLTVLRHTYVALID